MGAQGSVSVIVTITRDGNMVRPFIPKKGDKSLDDEALSVISIIDGDWVPLLLDGNPTDCMVLLHVSFDWIST